MVPHWEPLGPGCKVLVSPSHRFNTDTLLLAHFARPRPGEPCADLGCGCGTIALLWCHRAAPGPVVAIEIQPEAVDLATRSVRENGLEGAIRVMQGDIRAYKSLLPHQGLGLIACNPPYFVPGTGRASADPQRAAARHGDQLPLEALAQAARFSLKYGGRLCVCLPAWRLAEAVVVFHQHGLEPKRLRLVQAKPGKAPYLLLMECKSGGKPGLDVEPPLLIHEEGGDFSPEMTEIYGGYTQGPRKGAGT